MYENGLKEMNVNVRSFKIQSVESTNNSNLVLSQPKWISCVYQIGCYIDELVVPRFKHTLTIHTHSKTHTTYRYALTNMRTRIRNRACVKRRQHVLPAAEGQAEHGNCCQAVKVSHGRDIAASWLLNLSFHGRRWRGWGIGGGKATFQDKPNKNPYKGMLKA